MEPLGVIHNVNGGPYAINTMLGWTVNGPLKGKGEEAMDCEQPEVSINSLSCTFGGTLAVAAQDRFPRMQC